jgi:hypothetical protein
MRPADETVGLAVTYVARMKELRQEEDKPDRTFGA